MKWFGKIGYCETVETEPSVYEEQIVERDCYGDLIKNTRRMVSGDKVNEDMTLGNVLSVIADPYLQEHFCDIRYATMYGGKWKISEAVVNYPRLELTLGGLYHGN